MFRRDPSTGLGGLTFQANGIKIIYIVKGWARFDIQGLGEARLDAGALVCLPPANLHRLADAGSDFEEIEVELPLLMSSLTTTWAPDDPSAATSAMICPRTTESFRPIPNFDPGVERQFPIVRQMTGGAANALMLRANPPHVWNGTPWHIHHNNFYFSLMISGSHAQEYEDFGECIFQEGDFFVQQGDIRHRETCSTTDFEILTIEFPASSPATVLLFDERTGGYRSMMFSSSVELGEAC